MPDREELLIDGRGRNVEVLLDTREIREADVEELDVLVLDEAQHLDESLNMETPEVGHSGSSVWRCRLG